MPEIELTKDQVTAIDGVMEYVKNGNEKGYISLGGYAGTGKTFTVSEIVKKMEGNRPSIAFCAFTGKAASVLRSRLHVSGFDVTDDDYCGTIHGMMYKPVKAWNPETKEMELKWEKVEALPYDLIMVDEASMVSERIFNDLLHYEVPIVAIGDHGQLPPVGDRFSLMMNPDLRLETVHRQACDNPIVKLSMMARTEGRIEFGEYGNGVLKTRDKSILKRLEGIETWMTLCGKNATRVRFNSAVRNRMGMDPGRPVPGDRVICLKNNRGKGIYNGMMGVMKELSDDGMHYMSKIEMDGCPEPFEGKILMKQFGNQSTLRGKDMSMQDWQLRDQFDWGYCLTVHKSQGSEADRVLVFEERLWKMTDGDYARWLYTAVTRSKKELVILKM